MPDHVAKVFVQVLSPPLGWSPLSSFLVMWPPSGDMRGPSVVFEEVDVHCTGPLIFCHIANHVYVYICLPDPDVGPADLVCDVEQSRMDRTIYSKVSNVCLQLRSCSHPFLLSLRNAELVLESLLLTST